MIALGKNSPKYYWLGKIPGARKTGAIFFFSISYIGKSEKYFFLVPILGTKFGSKNWDRKTKIHLNPKRKQIFGSN